MTRQAIDPNQKPVAYPGDPEVTLDIAATLGVTDEEYTRIQDILGRMPTWTELGIFSVMWSEHASYKNSILELKKLPRSGGRLLVGAGEENAGLVDIGDNLAVAFKVESHNHPSAVEPYQGAATGVGGILRDVFTMGARPIALLDSLRFGPPEDERVRFLVDGVVRGIADYGNCMGIPTVGGEIYFEESYRGNPLVNAMAVGIMEPGKMMSAAAKGVGNPVIYIGSRTGRDGIHGATFASVELSEESQSRKSNVQVGDPFMEKLLLEATLALADTGAVVGIQDMGAAGLTCSSSEMAAKTGMGIVLDLNKVPKREQGMTPYETLLSESQERMLLVAEKGREQEIFDVAEHWELQAVEIGYVTDDGRMKVMQDGLLVADIPANDLALGGGAPVYERDVEEPEYLKSVKTMPEFEEPTDLKEAALSLLARPNIASKKHVFRQYDSMVRGNTKVLPGRGDAAVVRIPGTNKALGMATDCNGRFTYLNPRQGAAMAVAEAARNVACTGAEPLGVTNCLNFGNPYKPQMYWTFREAVAGMGEACRALNTPVTGGNVSFYNESPTGAVFPTPVIGIVGLAEEIEKTVGMGATREGDAVFLIGADATSWAGSEWQVMQHGQPYGELPPFNLDLEVRLQQLIITAIRAGYVQAAHDLAEGGLVTAAAEMCIADPLNPQGMQLEFEEISSLDLFGEGPSRVLIIVEPAHVDDLEELARKNDVPAEWIGTTGGKGLGFRTLFSLSFEEMSKAYYHGLSEALGIE
ncbi:phosphoribosylformylglycinamidine synthase subunit PurL [bacterium]|nr:phosphoribosylformylglycinamidine synthase subunit PurL [bacterium]